MIGPFGILRFLCHCCRQSGLELAQRVQILVNQQKRRRKPFLNRLWSNFRIPVHYCILEAASFEERGISIHMQISGQVF